jgi:hypothetical protein
MIAETLQMIAETPPWSAPVNSRSAIVVREIVAVVRKMVS